jgi:hypothetical protein
MKIELLRNYLIVADRAIVNTTRKHIYDLIPSTVTTNTILRVSEEGRDTMLLDNWMIWDAIYLFGHARE